VAALAGLIACSPAVPADTGGPGDGIGPTTGDDLPPLASGSDSSGAPPPDGLDEAQVVRDRLLVPPDLYGFELWIGDTLHPPLAQCDGDGYVLLPADDQDTVQLCGAALSSLQHYGQATLRPYCTGFPLN